MDKNISYPLDWWGMPLSMKGRICQNYAIWKTTLPDDQQAHHARYTGMPSNQYFQDVYNARFSPTGIIYFSSEEDRLEFLLTYG